MLDTESHARSSMEDLDTEAL
ncbi:hypothetical protein FOXYS1_10543, partial [Fusarium oxysporum]